jgi:nucleoside 2-deoxyribosyltransferase
MTDQLANVENVSSIITNIEGLIGLSAAGLPRSKQEFSVFEPADGVRYEELWLDIDHSLASLRAAGFYFANPNPHQRLSAMRGFLSQSDRSIGMIRRIPGELYSDLRRSLEILRDALRDAHAPIEIQRELRESARRTNELFIIVACRSECEAFLRNIAEPAAESVGLKPVVIERNEPEEAISEAILSRIRRSVLVLCDLTFARPNCYYEAGYAKGSFRRVIFTSRDDHDPRGNPDSPFKVHFDVDQLKITWWNLDKAQGGLQELESRLRMLIEELGLHEQTTNQLR